MHCNLEMPYKELNCLTIAILSNWTVQLKITKFPRNQDWMYSDKINGFITPSVPPLSLLLWITSGRLDRSVYKQGQVVYKKQNLHKHQQYIIQFWNAMYWMYSGRLDRSVYKQGQVVCPTVECTVEKGEDGSLMVDLKLEFPALTDEYERLKSYSMRIFDNKWWLFEDSTYVNMTFLWQYFQWIMSHKCVCFN